MYINKENNISYPNIINDLNVDINCERLFDKLYLNFKKYQKIKNDSRSQAYDSTVYDRADFITFIEQNPKFLNKFGKVSSSKLVDYSAKILMKQSLLNYSEEEKSKIDMNKEYYAAKKLVIQDSENFKGNDKHSRMPNGQPFSYDSTSYYKNQAQQQAHTSDDSYSLKIPSFMLRNDYHRFNHSNNIHLNVIAHNSGTNKKRNSHSNKSKRRIKGINKSKKLFYRGIAISALVASLTACGINHSIANHNLINNTSYQTAQSNSISPSMYLSNKGDKNSLLYSPMFGSDGFNKSNMFSDKSKFDVSILKLYEEYGNYGISEYISQKIDSGEMLSISDMKNLSKANKVFSLSVMQDELINSLGNKKNDKVKYAGFLKPELDPEELFSEGDHIILFYDQHGFQVDKAYYADKYISQYIKDSEDYFSQIDKKFDHINKKIKNNPNYDKSVDYYRNLIAINDLISKNFDETTTFAIRNHEKHFSIPDDKIVTKGVDFNSKKEVDKMKIDLNHNNDERDGR